MAGAQLMGWDETNGVWVRCVVTEDGKLIINPTGFLENPPTEDEDKKAPTSEWAFDHAANVAAHHTKYTDAESRAAIGDQFGPTGQALKDLNMGYKAVNYANPFTFRVAASDTSQITFQKVSKYEIMNLLCNKFGVGLVDFNFRIYNGTGYTSIIRADTFQANLALFLVTTLEEDVENKAPTSKWAFDHVADSSSHHTRFTPREACDAFDNLSVTMGNGVHSAFDMTNYNMIFADSSSGDVDLRGMANGYDGQYVLLVRSDVSYQLIIRHYSASAASGDKIVTPTGADQTAGIAQYGGAMFFYKNGVWNMLHSLG